MQISDIKKNADLKMHASIEALKGSLGKVRTGRANPALLDTVHVDYYGAMLPLSQVANLSLLDSRTIGVAPWEKGMGAKIEKAIRESDLGLNPASQGDLIRVPIPAMTEERRKELTKVVKGEAEHAKVAIRNLRRDANEQLKKLVKDKLASEDDDRHTAKDVAATDHHRHLHPEPHHLGDFLDDAPDGGGVDAKGVVAHQGFAGELEQDALVGGHMTV